MEKQVTSQRNKIARSKELYQSIEYALDTFDALKGFISGLYAGNYDISQIVPSEISPDVEKFLDWLEKFSEKHGIKFVVTISADASLATDGISKYF